MSRARGKKPSKSNKAGPAYKSSLDYVEQAIVTYRKVCEKRGSFPHWRSRWDTWSKKRPLCRDRTSGLVGPEPDFSARESNVPRRLLWELVYEAGLPTHFFQSLPHAGNGVVVANHDCIGSFGWTDHQVRVWTTLANRAGIEYSGNRDYKLPKHLSGYTPREFTFKEKVLLGLIPSHRRSETAKIRRAARRGIRGAFTAPVDPQGIFRRKYRLSCKEIRQEWFHNHSEIPFKEFKSNCEVGIALYPRGCRGPISSTVFEALRRIYQKPLKLRDSDLGHFSKVDNDLKFVLEAPLPMTRKTQVSIDRTVKTKRLKRGALVLSYRKDLHDLRSTLNSTIPRIGSRDDIYSDLEWSDYGDYRHARLPRPYDLNLNSWVFEDSYLSE